MPRDISDMFQLAITLYENQTTTSPIFRPMQGRLDGVIMPSYKVAIHN